MWWPYLILLAVLFGLVIFGQRRRRQQMGEQVARMSQIGFGSEVMTTSGLYGTVVAKNDDGTVQLAIAPGVEVKWALAALRDPESLPAEYRRPISGEDPDQSDGSGTGAQPTT